MRNLKGFSILEVIIALGVGAIVVVAVATFLNQLDSSQKQLDLQIKANDYYNELTEILTNPGLCEKAIGGGYNPFVSVKGLAFNLGTGVPAINLREVSDPSKNRFTVHNGPLNQAPNSAKPDRQLVIRQLELSGISPLGAPHDAEYINPAAPSTAILMQRRTVSADLVTRLEPTFASSVALRPKSIPVILEIERPRPPAPGVWRIRQCGGAKGDGSQLGWIDTNVPVDCIVLREKANHEVKCPGGMYLVRDKFNIKTKDETYPCSCGKSGCATCGATEKSAVPVLTCCPGAK